MDKDTLSEATVAAMVALVTADLQASKQTKERIIAFIRGGAEKKPLPELLTRRQVADMVKKTPTMVDNYARQGLIKRVKLGNSSRASGFDRDSVLRFLGVAV